PARNFTHDSSVPSTAEPTAAPMTSWATGPTTISDRAVEMRSQIDSRLATSASPSQSDARAQNPVIGLPPAPPSMNAAPDDGRARQRTGLEAAGSRDAPTDAKRPAGVISLWGAVLGDSIPVERLILATAPAVASASFPVAARRAGDGGEIAR